MAHSIQVYGNKSAIFNDLDLFVFMGFAIEIINKFPEFGALRSMAMKWQNSLPVYGPGTIDLGLQELIQKPDTVEKFEALLVAILERVSQYGKTIPAEVLNEQTRWPGVKFKDFEIVWVEETVEKLRGLITSQNRG